MECINARLGTLSPKSAINQYYPLNITFHDRLVELSQHSALLGIYRRLIDQMHLLRRRGYESGDGLIRSHREHAAILSALKQRDAEAASRAICVHAMSGMERFLAL